jgi:hypothetical protein
MAQLPPQMPAMPEEGIPQEGIVEQPPMESAALQIDEDQLNESAVKIVASSKARMYGDDFDQFMQVLQSSDNLVEDLAMISLNLIVPEIQAVSSSGDVPFDYLMDASAEVVSEAYDMAVQTGVYQPSNEEEVERNQNITLTMVAGELGKTFSDGDSIPEGSVEHFIESVMDGNYDNLPTEADVAPDMPPAMPRGGISVAPEGGMPI